MHGIWVLQMDQGVFFAGILFSMGLFTSWEVPGCLQPMDPWLTLSTFGHFTSFVHGCCVPLVDRLLGFPLPA